MTDAPATGDRSPDRDPEGTISDPEAAVDDSSEAAEEYDSVPASEHIAHGEPSADLVEEPTKPDVPEQESTHAAPPPALVEPPEREPDAEPIVVPPEKSTDREAVPADITTTRAYSEPDPTPEPVVEPEPAVAAGPAPAVPAAASSSFFVEPAVAPRARHNRGFGVGVALLSSLIFAALYGSVVLGISTLFLAPSDFAAGLIRFLYSPAFWVPVVAYAVLAVLAALILNRARWAAHVFVSLLVGILVYVVSVSVILLIEGYLGAGSVEQYRLLITALTQPVLFAAAICAREVALWTGLATAARGRRVVARNRSDREAYEQEKSRAEAVWDAPTGAA